MKIEQVIEEFKKINVELEKSAQTQYITARCAFDQDKQDMGHYYTGRYEGMIYVLNRLSLLIEQTEETHKRGQQFREGCDPLK